MSSFCSHQLLETIKNENEEKKSPKINLGSEFQASIPEKVTEDVKFDHDPSYEHLLWDPGINDTLDDNEGNYSHRYDITYICTCDNSSL